MEPIKVQGVPLPAQSQREIDDEIKRQKGVDERYAKWLIKFKDKHGDKYTYPEIVADVRGDVPTPITCSVHGAFTQMPLNHARGANCPKCAKEAAYKSYAAWVKEFREVHGDKYEYPEQPAEVGSRVSLHITCKIHGVFRQVMDNHLRGDGCFACGNLNKRKPYTEYIADFRRIHGDKYVYPIRLPINKVGAKVKLSITCKLHGEFSQVFNSHLAGCGCPHCFNESQTKTYSSWLPDFVKIHKDRYKYPATVEGRINAKTKIAITCILHGEFLQTLDGHSQGKGCPKCAWETNGLALAKSYEDWVAEFRVTHGNKYEYRDEGLSGKDTKITITCKDHGEFTQTPHSHANGCGCPACFSRVSKANLEIAEFVETLGVAAEKEFRIVGGKRHLFIDLKAGNLGIEHDGLYWHSTKFVQGKGDLPERRISMAKAGLAMFSIYEDEWLFKREVVQHLLRERLSASFEYVQHIQQSEKLSVEDGQLLNTIHLEGSSAGEVVRAVDSAGNVVAIAIFKRKTDCTAELVRYAVNKRVLGTLYKCVAEYSRTHTAVTRLETFTDNRYNDDALYTEAGFVPIYLTSPDYMYIKSGKRHHKSNFQKSKLAKMFPGEDMSLSEKEITERHKIYRIYDCGKTKWELTL